jgi:hypothetical protein
VSVPVRGTIRAARNGQFTERHAAEIGERLIALERALAGAMPTIVSPAAPAYGAGSVDSTTVINNITQTGETDHGALTGLGDNDHPQYLQHLEPAMPKPHVHGPDDVLSLDQRFYRKGEAARPAPHTHTAQDIAGIDLDRPQPVRPHAHVAADVADLRPDDAQFVIAARVYGG